MRFRFLANPFLHLFFICEYLSHYKCIKFVFSRFWAYLSHWNNYFQLYAATNIVSQIYHTNFGFCPCNANGTDKWAIHAIFYKAKNMLHPCPGPGLFFIIGFLFFGQRFVAIPFFIYLIDDVFLFINLFLFFACMRYRQKTVDLRLFCQQFFGSLWIMYRGVCNFKFLDEFCFFEICLFQFLWIRI